MTDSVQEILQYCPAQVREAVAALPNEQRKGLEELRFRIGQSVTYGISGREWVLLCQKKPILVNRELIDGIISKASSFSRYAVDHSMQSGFLEIAGGHRLGICGAMRYHDGNWTMDEISSLNLRLSRQIYGIADSAMNLLWAHPESTLLLGPPGCGKTTLLREIVRQLSDRFQLRVGLVDERGELAAAINGQPQFSVGRYTDVLTGVNKEKGIAMLVRTMRPEWIVVDEITQQGDLEAMQRASYCGVQLLASAHAFSREDLESRPLYRKMMEQNIFQNLIVIDRNRKVHCQRAAP